MKCSIVKTENGVVICFTAEPGDDEEKIKILRDFRHKQAQASKTTEGLIDEIKFFKPIEWPKKA